MRVRAALVETPGDDFQIADLELVADLAADEVLVEIAATGMCQTDLHIARREYPVPFPVVPGHEGAGIVRRTGSDVIGLEPGDAVILSYPSCGRCRACLRQEAPYCDEGFRLSFGGARLAGDRALRRGDEAIHGHIFQQSSFATWAISTSRNTIKVPDFAMHLPLEQLGPLGCSLQTGAGTVLRSLNVSSGESLVVVGVGAVGLAAVMAAASAEADAIVAVDVVPSRLAMARELGATHIVDARVTDLVAGVRAVLPGGADHVIELSGRPDNLGRALEATRLGGTVAFVAGTPSGTTAEIDLNTLLNGRRVRGVIQGDAMSADFIPQLLRLHVDGRFPFERLISFYDLDDIQRAADGLRSGSAIKPVVRMPIGTAD